MGSRRILRVIAATAGTVVGMAFIHAAYGVNSRDRLYSLTSRRHGERLLLSLRDPRSLVPVARALQLSTSGGHAQVVRVFSPDGWELALAGETPARKHRTALTFVDLERMRVSGRMTVAGDLVQMVWPTPRRLLAFVAENPASARTHDLPLYVIDPVTHRLVRTVTVPPLKVVRTTSAWVVGIFTPPGSNTARIARIDTNGSLRTIDTRISGGATRVRRGGIRYEVIREPGLAIAPNGRKAYVIGPGQRLVEVDLRTLALSRHKLHPALPAINKVETSSIVALSLGDSLIALSGGATTFPLNANQAPRSRPFGLRLLNTETWKVKMVDPYVDTAPVPAGDGMIVFHFGGAVGFSLDGTRRFIVHDTRLDPNGTAFGCGRYFYFQTDNSRMTRRGSPALALDAATGRKVGQTHLAGADLIWLDSPCTDPS